MFQGQNQVTLYTSFFEKIFRNWFSMDEMNFESSLYIFSYLLYQVFDFTVFTRKQLITPYIYV